MSCSSPPDTVAPYIVEDLGGALQVLSDGTVVRSLPPAFPAADVNDGRVEWKDAVYDAGRGLRLRMYKPHRHLLDVADDGDDGKHPVIVYFHGGGFCIGSYCMPKDHAVCLRLAAELPAVVLSFDYRLAPEHRLPAAHEDAAAALLWLRDELNSDRSWHADSADPRRVFVSGVSAGGNLAHHMAVRFGTSRLEPVASIVGYILLMPGLFSGEPTQSELDTPGTASLTREMFDGFFRLGMPAGASRDHPLVNPFGPGSPSLEATSVGRMLVVAAECDLFRDRNVEYAERMKAMRKDVELVVFAGQEHGFFGVNPASEADSELMRIIKCFVDFSK